MADNSFVEFCLAEAQALADYTSIASDLRTARDFALATLAENNKSKPNYPLSEALMVATIIRYARAFSLGVRLHLYEEAASILTDQQRKRHKYFMAIRDKYIAHSVNAFEESQPVARYWIESVQEEGIDSIECNHRRIVGLSNEDLIDIRDLAVIWLQHVRKRIKEEKIRLLPIVQKIPLQELFRNAPRSRPDTSQPSKRRKPLRNLPYTKPI